MPECGWIAPTISLASVDLPARLGPTMATISPGSTRKVIFLISGSAVRSAFGGK